MSVFCWKCGKNLRSLFKDHEARFCVFCGARVVHPRAQLKSPHTPHNDTAATNHTTSAAHIAELKTDKQQHQHQQQQTDAKHATDDTTEQSPPPPPTTTKGLSSSESASSLPSPPSDEVKVELEDMDGYRERGANWVKILRVQEFKSKFLPGMYTKLKNTPSNYVKKIRKDIARTFPKLSFFTEERQEQLFSIVKAYSVYDNQLGYSQGMAFIAGYLFLHMSEEDAFWSFVKIMFSKEYNLRELFDGQSDALQLCLQEYDQLLRARDPKLAAHLEEKGIDATMYGTQWLLTIFLYRFPFHLVPIIWDRFIANGTVALFQVGLCLLGYFREKLLTFDHEEFIPFFNQLDKQQIPDMLLTRSKEIVVTREQLKYVHKKVFNIPSAFDPETIDADGVKRKISL